MSDLIGFLVSRGIVSFLTMDAAVQRMREQGGRLGTSLLEVDTDLDPRRLVELIAEFAGLKPGYDELLVQADPDLAQLWSDVRARRMAAMPVRLEGNRIDMAVLEPLTELEMAELNEEFGCVIVQYSVPEFRFFQLLHRFYETDVDERFLSLAGRFPLRAPAPATNEDVRPLSAPTGGRDTTAELERTTGSTSTLATSPQEPVADEDDAPVRRGLEDTTSPQGNVREDSTSPQESVREDTTSPQDNVREDSTSPQESVREDTTSPQESVREDSTSPQDAVDSETVTSPQEVQRSAQSATGRSRKEPSLPSISISPAAGVYASSTSRTDDSGARLFAAALAPGRRDSTADLRPTSATEAEESEFGADWTLEQLSSFYQKSQDRDAMLMATLGYLSRIFRRRFFLSFGSGRVRGFAAGGIEEDHVACDQVEIPFDRESTLQRIKDGVTYFHGPPDEVGLLTLYTRMRVDSSQDLVVVPLRLGNTAIMILAGDNGPDEKVSEDDLPHLFAVFNRLALSLEQLIERNRLIAAGRLADITPTGVQPLDYQDTEEDDEWEQSPGDLLETSSGGSKPAAQRQMRQHVASPSDDPHEFDFAELARDLVGEEGSQTVNVAAAFREALAASARPDSEKARKNEERKKSDATQEDDAPAEAAEAASEPAEQSKPQIAEELANIWDDLDDDTGSAFERDDELGDAAARALQEESTWFLLDKYEKQEADKSDVPSADESKKEEETQPTPTPDQSEESDAGATPTADESKEEEEAQPTPDIAKTTGGAKRSPTMAWRSKDLEEVSDELRTRAAQREDQDTPVSGLIPAEKRQQESEEESTPGTAAAAAAAARRDTAPEKGASAKGAAPQTEEGAGTSLPEAGKSAFERWLAQRNAYRKRGDDAPNEASTTQASEGTDSEPATKKSATQRDAGAKSDPDSPPPPPQAKRKKLTEPTRIALSGDSSEEPSEQDAQASSEDDARGSSSGLSLAERLRRGRTQSPGVVPGPVAKQRSARPVDDDVPPPPPPGPGPTSSTPPVASTAPGIAGKHSAPAQSRDDSPQLPDDDFDMDAWDPTLPSEDSRKRFVAREKAATASYAVASSDVPPPPPEPKRPSTLSGGGAPSRVPGKALTNEAAKVSEESGLHPTRGTMSMSRLPAHIQEQSGEPEDKAKASEAAAPATPAPTPKTPAKEEATTAASAPSASSATEISTLVKLDDLSEDQRRTHTQAHGVVSASLEALLFEDESLTADAIADLVGRSARQMPSIVASFPGPLRLDRHKPDEDARPVREHGPLLSVVSSRLEVFVPQLWSCLERKNPEARYYALRLLAYVRELELRYALIEAAFDEDNQVRRLALHLLSRQRSSTDFSLALDAVRSRLSSDDPSQQEAAIVAVTRLRDFSSIPELIEMLERADASLRPRVEQALQRLTCDVMGQDAARWRAWWEAHEHEPPEAWVATAMTSEELLRRELAEKALRTMSGLTINFHANISERGQRRARRTFERHFRLA